MSQLGAAIAFFGGQVLICAGVAMISIPGAIITAGCMAVICSLAAVRR